MIAGIDAFDGQMVKWLPEMITESYKKYRMFAKNLGKS